MVWETELVPWAIPFPCQMCMSGTGKMSPKWVCSVLHTVQEFQLWQVSILYQRLHGWHGIFQGIKSQSQFYLLQVILRQRYPMRYILMINLLPLSRYDFFRFLENTGLRKLVLFTYFIQVFPLEELPLFKRVNDSQISCFNTILNWKALKSSCDVIKRKEISIRACLKLELNMIK